MKIYSTRYTNDIDFIANQVGKDTWIKCYVAGIPSWVHILNIQRLGDAEYYRMTFFNYTSELPILVSERTKKGLLGYYKTDLMAKKYVTVAKPIDIVSTDELFSVKEENQ